MMSYIYYHDELIWVSDHVNDKKLCNDLNLVFKAICNIDVIIPDSNFLQKGILIIKEDYDLLDDLTKKFVILHEVGHLKLQNAKGLHKRKLRYECDADEYTLSELSQDEVVQSIHNFIKVLVDNKRINWRRPAYWELLYREYNIKSRIPFYIKPMMYLMGYLNLVEFWKTTKTTFKIYYNLSYSKTQSKLKGD